MQRSQGNQGGWSGSRWLVLLLIGLLIVVFGTDLELPWWLIFVGAGGILLLNSIKRRT